MANPQREDGHLDVANELADALARTRLNSTQSCILWVIMRKTYGWNKKIDRISLSQFAEATGIHPKQIARELGRLAARRIIIEWGDDHHPKEYGIQKDHSRWISDEKVSTKTLTHIPGDMPHVSTEVLTVEREVSTESFQSVNDSAPKVSTEPFPTITRNTTTTKTKETEPHGSAASGTLRQRFESDYRAATDGSKRIGVIGRYFQQMLGPPNYARLGQLLKEAGSGGALFAAMLEASKQSLTDDPHDYVATVIHNGAKPGVRATHTARGGRGEPRAGTPSSWRRAVGRD